MPQVTPGKVQEVMRFRKVPDVIQKALFQASYSTLSHFEHLVIEAISITVVRGKDTEL